MSIVSLIRNLRIRPKTEGIEGKVEGAESEVDKALHSLGIKPLDSSYQSVKETLEKYGENARKILAGISKEERRVIGQSLLEAFNKCGVTAVETALGKLNKSDKLGYNTINVLYALVKYDAERVKRVLEYGYSAKYLDYICPIFDELKAARDKGGKEVRYRLTFPYAQKNFEYNFETYASAFELPYSPPEKLKHIITAQVRATGPVLEVFKNVLSEKFKVNPTTEKPNK